MKTSLLILCASFFLVACAKNHPIQTKVNKYDRAMYQKKLADKTHTELNKEIEKLEK